jgi:hypothetical protein
VPAPPPDVPAPPPDVPAPPPDVPAPPPDVVKANIDSGQLTQSIMFTNGTMITPKVIDPNAAPTVNVGQIYVDGLATIGGPVVSSSLINNNLSNNFIKQPTVVVEQEKKKK